MSARPLTKVHKSNHLNQADFGDFGLSTYRVFLNSIAKMQRHDITGNLIPLNLVNRECLLSVDEYAKEFNIEGNTAYEILYFAIDKLLNTQFKITTNVGLLKINICSQALYIKNEGRIIIKFTEEIMPHLAELSNNFTMYNLCEISGFNSFYTTRFYELLMQYKTTGNFNISIADLRFKLGCVNVLIRYNDFKRFGFAHAVEEINKCYEMHLQYKEIKTGKVVTKLEFTFKCITIHQTYDIVKQKYRNQLSKQSRKKLP